MGSLAVELASESSIALQGARVTGIVRRWPLHGCGAGVITALVPARFLRQDQEAATRKRLRRARAGSDSMMFSLVSAVVSGGGPDLAGHGRAVCCGAVRRQTKLNNRRLAVLRRIGAGGDPVTARNPELARTVYALCARRLVTTPRTEGVWVAQLVDAGRFYLEHGQHPILPTPSNATPAAPASPLTGPRARRGMVRICSPWPVPADAVTNAQVRATAGLQTYDPAPWTVL